jgi:hypothetical protein
MTETEYTQVVMDSGGSPILRRIAGWDELMACQAK